MTDGGKTGGGATNSGTNNATDMMNVNQQGQVMITQQNMASLQHHQQALQMQQQQASMEGLQQTSQNQQVNQPQTLLVNTANLHQQLQNASNSAGGGNTGGISNQGGNQTGANNNTMCLQQQAIQSSMASSQIPQAQQIGSISLQGTNVGTNHSGSTTITTMSTLPQQQQTAAPQQLQQVQVIQQPMQNAYVQQLYNAQGQMLMSALHPNMNPGSIQVIAASKPFQSNQLTSHVLSKPVLTANTQQGSFPSYATIPTTTNQTLVITGGQLGVISSQLPQAQAKPPDLQKKAKLGCSSFQTGGGTGSGVKPGSGNPTASPQQVLQNCVASHPMLHHLISPIQYTTCGNGQRSGVTTQAQTAQAVQFASPWQFPQIPQVWATAQSPHPQVIQNPIFIRGTQQDQPMYIQQSSPPTQSIQQQPQPQQSVSVAKQEIKTVTSPQVSRTLSILPSTSMAPPIRPAASTQIVKSQQIKMRTKAVLTKSNILPQKMDINNQVKAGVQQTTVSPQIPQQILPATKMIITSQGTIVQAPIENKVVGQVSAAQPQAAITAIPQTAVAMQQAAAITMPQTAAVIHQPQLIQPKPPPLMSLSMPSLEPLPVAQSEKSVESIPATLEVLPTIVSASPNVVTTHSVEQQDGLSEQMQQDDTVNLISPTMPQENGQTSNDSKVEPMEVVDTDPPPPVQQPQQPQALVPIQNGISAGSGIAPSTAPANSTTASVPIRPSSPSVANNAQMANASPVVAPQIPHPPQEESKEKKTPKAMIKPHSQVLTHIIEGYVIQESSEPFPINRTNLLSDISQPTKVESVQPMESANEPPVKKQSLDISATEDSNFTSDKLKCEICGKIDLKEKFKKKRFCSTTCARRGSSSGRKRSKSKDDVIKNDKEWVEGDGEAVCGVSNPDTNSETSSEPISNPIKWTVAEVCDFIKNLPGCTDYAEDFAIQEIDGQALMLLKADHLMSAMSMKLGPALKICAKIDTMRSEAQANGQPTPV